MIGLEVHAQVVVEGEAVFGRRDRVRGRAEHPGLAGRCRLSRHAAGHQPALRRAGGQDRARPRRRDQSDQRVRPQELFLPRPAGRLSDLAIPAADRRPWPGRARHARRLDARDRHHPAASRAGRRQEPARPAPEPDLCRSEPRRGRADGDRLRARSAQRRGGRDLSAQAALDPALSRHLRRQHGGGLDALRRQRLGAPPGRAATARAARSRTSTRSALSCRRSSTRRGARSSCSRRAARSRRRRGCSTPGAA